MRGEEKPDGKCVYRKMNGCKASLVKATEALRQMLKRL